jgi:DNA-binding NtrC family response regulator
VRIRNKVIDFGHFAGYSLCMKSRATILVVDDDSDVLTAARLLLRQYFEQVLTSADPADVPALMDKNRIDVFLVDMNFAIGSNRGVEGLNCLELIRSIDPDAVVVLMTAFGDLNTAVQAMREGASDFILKPWQNEKLLATISVAAELRRMRAKVDRLTGARQAGDSKNEALNLEANERRMVMRALEEANGNISRAAAALGITRSALYRRIEKFGL